MRQALVLSLLTLMVAGSAALLIAGDRPKWDTPDPKPPEIAAASDEGERALRSFRVPQGVTGKLFAAEPMIANVVALYVDHQGRVYACETFRQSKGIEDNRGHAHWLDDDLAAQTVQDRYDYIQKHLGDKAIDYTREDDRIRLLVDADGDFVADKATVFADRFNEVVAGTGAGVLAYQGKVYYTCIPDLWVMEDENGDLQADSKESLHYGFGVRFAFRGHDMHGLTIGPDGRLYFSIGDRGYNVETYRGNGTNPESGGVFRCELDGSKLEVFAMGLRNPQELAFDDYGNLFTGDNNSDSGDKARWVYVVEGGDTGWRMSYQYLGDRGPFNREKIWHPSHDGQPAYIIPPVANFADGPSGLAYYPGTGFGDDFKGRFFLCDFRGQASNSGIRSLRVKPKGAFFELVDDEQPFWNILATDLQFGPDGGLYVSDWVNGWEGLGKGRIYRFADEQQQQSALVKETRTLLASDFTTFDENRLTQLLAHADQRVRREAQFELARREAFEALDGVARHNDSQLARLHALWGLEQLARREIQRDAAAETFAELLLSDDDEVRAQAAKMLGEIQDANYAAELENLLKDASRRVRYMAAMSLGKLETESSLDAVASLLMENNNADPILRHGGIMALVGIGQQDPATVAGLTDHPSPAVRLAAVVALRKLGSDRVVEFLSDAEPSVVLEAARVIHDLPLEESMPALAELIRTPSDSDPLLRRVLNANYRLGTPVQAALLARFAAQSSAPEAMRIEAIDMLGSWEKPSNRDRVLGMWRPLNSRASDVAADALREQLPALLSQGGDVASRAIDVASRLGIREIAPNLLELLQDPQAPAQSRANALRALGLLKYEGLADLLEQNIAAEQVALRATALDLLADSQPQQALALIGQRINSAEVAERQQAVQSLAKLTLPAADEELVALVRRLQQGTIPADTQLEVWEAARQHKSAAVQEALAEYEDSLEDSNPLAAYQVALVGGDAEAGRRLFYERTSLSCVRCHMIGEAGGQVGPNLSGIGIDKKREYLLESIVAPSQTIAKGFEGVLVQTIDGAVLAGIVKEATDAKLVLITADGNLIEVRQDDIEEVVPGKSSMPEDLMKYLSRRELRDLIEFLAQQQTAVNP